MLGKFLSCISTKNFVGILNLSSNFGKVQTLMLSNYFIQFMLTGNFLRGNCLGNFCPRKLLRNYFFGKNSEITNVGNISPTASDLDTNSRFQRRYRPKNAGNASPIRRRHTPIKNSSQLLRVLKPMKNNIKTFKVGNQDQNQGPYFFHI